MLKPGGKRNHATAQRQRGLTLIETLIAMVISLVAAMSMISLMANTLGTGTRTIQMTRLTSELRAALQIMTRDVRRANYHGNFIQCFANVACRSSLEDGGGDASSLIKSVSVPRSSCFQFWLDRDSDGQVVGEHDHVGAFQLSATDGGIGVIEMMVEESDSNPCGDPDDGDWIAITNPENIDVTAFTVDNALSYTDTIAGNHAMRIDKIRVRLTGALVADNTVTRTVEDIIRVRNDTYTPAP
jgi:prepilin-type N-terminal cleavage/methylation domain-containing protein